MGMMRLGMCFALVAGVAAGCRAPSIVARPNVPTMPEDRSRCRMAAVQERPLVTEWTAAEKANLESKLREGGVVVSFTGCSMTVLPQCRAPAPYSWVRTTPSTDALEISNEDELYAKLPLGAVALEGELKGSGRLVVQTTVTGQLRLAIPPGVPHIEGECAAATHVVGALSIGTFQLTAGGTNSARGEVNVSAVGNGRMSSTASEQVIRQAGNSDACGNATYEAPDPACASPIQMFLLPVHAGMATGGPVQPFVRPPSAPISIQLLSADPDTSWDVIVDGRQACTTPCTQEIHPSRSLLMRERNTFLTRESRVTVDNLHGWAPVGGVQLKAHTTSSWNFSGLTRMGGIFYGVIGAGFAIPCFTSDDEDHDMFCLTSAVTAGFGAALFILGNWVMDSPGRVDTNPLGGNF